jgi:hypothetical protein
MADKETGRDQKRNAILTLLRPGVARCRKKRKKHIISAFAIHTPRGSDP